MTGSLTTRQARSWTTVLDGERLRELRREHGLSQEQLADRAGVSLTTVARLERRPLASCRGRTLARLAAALNESPSAFRPPTADEPPATTGTQPSAPSPR